jgi:transcriptional regulator with XRE-family HTH domain
VDNRSEVRQFLATRRAKITPEQAGLPFYGGNRRVPGLRREEVAMMAGVSADYYTRLEKGNLAGASDSVLHAIARALQLNEAEQAHLFDLAKTANTSPSRAPRRQGAPKIRPSVLRVLHSMTGTAAFLRNGRLDVLAINQLGRALYAPVFDDPARPANLARFNFLDPSSADFYPDWDDAADTSVALLHTEAGRDPYDRGLTDLVGELSTRSEAFRTRWAAHDVRLHRTGVKHFHHPVVGRLDLAFDAMEIPTDPSLTMTCYTAEPGTASDENLKLLASWAATNSAQITVVPPSATSSIPFT